MELQDKIISTFIHNEDYCRKVLPFTKPEYFEDRTQKVIIEEILRYFDKYNKRPEKDVLEIEALNRKDLTGTDATSIPKYLEALTNTDTNLEWLVEQTEKFYKKRAVYLAILDSLIIHDGEDKNRSEDSIPSILQDALAVSFDTQIGHDYLAEAEERYEAYTLQESGIQFDLKFLNLITDNVGLRRKTLTAIAARTGGGKSVGMCHIASSTLKQGKNVLYISLEMSEKMIGQRIDANLLGIPMNTLKKLGRESFLSKVERLKEKNYGTLVVKEYPMGSAHAGHFRALIEDLRTKKGFVPDLLVVDYLGICASQRIRNSAANTYTIMGSVAEELRSLGQEYDIPVLTGVQINRGGIESSDMDMTDTSDSMKIVHSLDLYIGFIRTEELDELGQIMVKQLKNRYGDPNYYRKFVIGMDASRSLLYDVEDAEQQNISESGQEDRPVFDRSKFGGAGRIDTSGLKF